jgi:hypothetical protein
MTPTTGFAKAVLGVERMFLRHALPVLIGVLPFALFAGDTTDKFVAGAWALVYATALLASLRVNVGMITDAVRVLFGSEPVSIPAYEREYERNKDKIEQAMAVIPRPILWLLEFLQSMNPLALTALLGYLYIRVKRPSPHLQPENPVTLGRSDVWAVYETRKATRRLDPRELMTVG